MSSRSARRAPSRKAASAICISLDAEHAGILERLAAAAGSRSAAVRLLLDEHERREREGEMEAAYRAYFAAPEAAAERAVTDGMLPAARWPADAGGKARSAGGDKKKRAPR